MATIGNPDVETVYATIGNPDVETVYEISTATYLRNDVESNRLIQQPFDINVDAENTESAEVVISDPEEESSALIGPELLTVDERKKNWIIRFRPRSKGNQTDMYCVHLQTGKQFRSLSTAYTFIVHGRLPPNQTERKAMSNNSAGSSGARRVRGDKLIKRICVGYYNLAKDEILREETLTEEKGPENSTLTETESLIILDAATSLMNLSEQTPSSPIFFPGDRKRKREEETTAPHRGPSDVNPAYTPPKYYVLYDFEPTD